jgi:hypothetical protein
VTRDTPNILSSSNENSGSICTFRYLPEGSLEIHGEFPVRVIGVLVEIRTGELQNTSLPFVTFAAVSFRMIFCELIKTVAKTKREDGGSLKE